MDLVLELVLELVLRLVPDWPQTGPETAILRILISDIPVYRHLY